MSWRVNSKRLAWPAGTVLSEADLAGCNITALVAGGHLAPVQERKSRKLPAEPVADESAEEPEEQE